MPAVKKSFLLFGLCLLLSFVFRSYSFYEDIVQIDEADFAAQGYMITQGAIPYVDFVEKKPLLSYYFFALPFYLLGWKMIGVHFLLVFWVSLTGFFLYKILALYGFDREGFLVALGYCLYSVGLPTNSSLGATPVNMMNLPLVGAVYFYLFSIKKEKISYFIPAGIFVGLASLFKHQGGILLLTFFLHLCFLTIKERKKITCFLFSNSLVLTGFLVPWLAAIAAYSRMGYLHQFVEWNFYNNFRYIQSGLPLGEKLLRLATDGGVYFASNIIFVFCSFYFLKKIRKISFEFYSFVVLWFLTTFIAVSAGGRFLTQYFVQLSPILILSGMMGFLEVFAYFPKYSKIRKIFIWGLSVSPVFWFFFHWFGHFPRPSVPVNREFGAYVNSISGNDDKIFVWGYLPYVYYMSQRQPGSRYIICEYLVPYWEKKFSNATNFDYSELTDWHKKNLALLIDDFKKNHPRFFIDLSTFDFQPHWAIYKLSRFAELGPYVLENYKVHSTFFGATIYELK